MRADRLYEMMCLESAGLPESRVADLESTLAATVASLDESRAEIASLEDELVAARSLADDWRGIAIQLAATCRDLRNNLAAASWAGHHTTQEGASRAQ